MITKVRKRDGSLAKFDKEKITNAILKAIKSIDYKDTKLAKSLSGKVTLILNKKFKIPNVEQIQDAVEDVLKPYPRILESYSEYRKRRYEVRRIKQKIGVRDELKLSANALKVLQNRYLLRDEKGKVIETPLKLFKRVAKAIADNKKQEKEFFEVMSRLEFLPNSPTLFNADTKLGQLSACFVLHIEDSLDSIFDAVKSAGKIQQSGGGVGYNFSRIRPRNDIVGSTKGIASGPVSFITIFDKVTDVIKQGSKRRGANMGILNVNHPDILEFINSKTKEGFLSNFNISVAVTDEFMNKVKENKDYNLINPRTNKIIGKLNAKKVFDLIVKNAWKTGDPGLIFIDEINRENPTPQIGKIESTNPCGEQPLLAYESCNLGSINLSKVVVDGKINWNKLGYLVRIGVDFLDNVIDQNKFPLEEIREITKANRKIGLGIMGFADFLIKLEIPYDSDKSLGVAEKVMKFIKEKAREESNRIANKNGSFPNIKNSIYKGRMLRNSTLTTVAPTGTISIIADTSSGIEPLFSVAYVREVMEGTRLIEFNKLFEETAKKRGFYSKELILKIAKQGSIQNIKEIPKDIKRIFVTAFDIKPEWHVKIQAAFQKYTDNAVSKTINLTNSASINDVEDVYLLAHKLKCKGITIYRYGSKKQQVLYKGKDFIKAKSEYSGGCPVGSCLF